MSFEPNHYVLLKHGNCIIENKKPDWRLPRKQENGIGYREFKCNICTCLFLYKTDYITSDIKCCNYECNAYIRVYKNSYYSYQPWCTTS